MNKVTSWLKAGLLFGGILLCAQAIIFLRHQDANLLVVGKDVAAVKSDIGDAKKDLHDSAAKLNTVLASANTAAGTLNASLKSIGTTFDAATGTINETKPKLTAALDSVTSLAGAATDTVNFAKPKIGAVLDHANRTLIESENAAMQVRKAELKQEGYWDESGKQTVAFLKKLNTVTDHADSAVQHGDKILADGQKVADRLAQPVNTVKRIGGWMWNSALHYLGAK